MDSSGAERAVVTSALIVGGVYAYRSFTEGSQPPATLKKLVGVGELPPLGSWATAWGFTFLVLSIIAEASPSLGGSLAILIAAGDLLANTANLIPDVTKQESAAAASKATTRTGQNLTVTAGASSTPPVQSGVAGVAGAATTGLGKIGTAAIP